MDKVIVTALLVIASVTAASMVMISILPAITSGTSAAVESNAAQADRIKTDIEILAVASNSTGTLIDAWVKNVGVARISAIDRSDVFLIKSGTRFDSITYDSAGTTKTWTGDLHESSSSWSRGDTLHIQIVLLAASADELATGDHILQFSTPNGISGEKTFERSE